MKSTGYLFLALTVFSCNETHQALPGTWEFIAEQEIDDQGNAIKEDRDVSGILIYTREGDMSVHNLYHTPRKPIMSDTIMRGEGVTSGLGLGINTWTAEQNRVLVDSYNSYFGEYRINGEQDIVTHVVFGNLRPEKTPVEFQRKFILKGDTLLLRSTNPNDRWQTVWLRKSKS